MNEMAKNKPMKPHGELRQSQVVGTFGPGAMLDLPNHSVLVAGLEQWQGQGIEIHEPRLVRKIQTILNIQSLKLYGPPINVGGLDGAGPTPGIRCYVFPEWFVTQDDMDEEHGGKRSRAMIPADALVSGKWIDSNRKKKSVVPVRFVRGCRKGHIGDIGWHALVHRGKEPCEKIPYRLYMDEQGTSGDLSEVKIRCAYCKNSIDMLLTTKQDQKVLGHCDGSRPWLGTDSKEKCTELNRLLVRTASNTYFPQRLSVISLPDRSDVIKKEVDIIWEFVAEVETADELKFAKKGNKVKAALETITEDELLAEITRRQTESIFTTDKPVKSVELETLIATKEELGEDIPDGDFYAKSLPKTVWDRPWMTGIERVVLVHRLREVVAQIGFTRFESISTRTDGDLEQGVESAPLAREVSWVPAIENRGEGVFLQFSRNEIEKWMSKDAVKARYRSLDGGYKAWMEDHKTSKRQFPGMPFHLLHSFAHMLISSVALECGYPSSSIRERVYAIDGLGYGVLIYTGTSDAEGTLGGLVQVGRNIHEHVKTALETSKLCSNDPVCAEHEPNTPHESRFLQGAACHGCLLIAETCCEQQNDFLDRALVVPTVDNLGAEFFQGLGG